MATRELIRLTSILRKGREKREEKLRVIHDALAVVGINSGLF